MSAKLKVHQAFSENVENHTIELIVQTNLSITKEDKRQKKKTSKASPPVGPEPIFVPHAFGGNLKWPASASRVNSIPHNISVHNLFNCVADHCDDVKLKIMHHRLVSKVHNEMAYKKSIVNTALIGAKVILSSSLKEEYRGSSEDPLSIASKALWIAHTSAPKD